MFSAEIYVYYHSDISQQQDFLFTFGNIYPVVNIGQ